MNVLGYCPMNGHAQLDCPGFPEEAHMDLCRQGIGFSRVPGPSDAELREETRADRELMLDEYHGRDLDGSVTW